MQSAVYSPALIANAGDAAQQSENRHYSITSAAAHLLLRLEEAVDINDKIRFLLNVLGALALLTSKSEVAR